MNILTLLLALSISFFFMKVNYLNLDEYNYNQERFPISMMWYTIWSVGFGYALNEILQLIR